MPSETIEQVIAAIRENRRRFEAFCRSLTEEQLNRPVPGSTWIVRDFAAHLDTLDTALVRMFAAPTTGENVDSGELAGQHFDVDEFNDAQVASRRDWSLDRIFAEAEANRVQLIEQLSQLTDEQIDKPMHFEGDSKRPSSDFPLKLFLVGWAQHDPIHAVDMLRGLPELADDPDLVAWVDNPYVKGYHAVMSK